MVSVQFNTTPAGAAIYVDNVDTFRLTPATVDVPAGSHTYLLRLSGYMDISGPMNLLDGYVYMLDAEMQKLTDIQQTEYFKQSAQVGWLTLAVVVIGGIASYFVYKKRG